VYVLVVDFPSRRVVLVLVMSLSNEQCRSGQNVVGKEVTVLVSSPRNVKLIRLP